MTVTLTVNLCRDANEYNARITTMTLSEIISMVDISCECEHLLAQLISVYPEAGQSPTATTNCSHNKSHHPALTTKYMHSRNLRPSTSQKVRT